MMNSTFLILFMLLALVIVGAIVYDIHSKSDNRVIADEVEWSKEYDGFRVIRVEGRGYTVCYVAKSTTSSSLSIDCTY
jgi:hypothetical protein